MNAPALLTTTNVMIGFSRVVVVYHFIRVLWGIVVYRILNVSIYNVGVMRAFCNIWVTIWLFILVNGAIFDSITGGSVPFGMQISFYDRIRLGRFLHMLGFTGNSVDVFLGRLIMYTSISLGMSFNRYNYSTFRSFFNTFPLTQNTNYLNSDEAFFLFVVFYVVLSSIYLPVSHFYRPLAHPWMASYANYSTIGTQRNNFRCFDIFNMSLNIVFKIFVFTVIVSTYSQGHFFSQVWVVSGYETLNIILILVLIPIVSFREIYLIFRMNRRQRIMSFFIWDGLFLSYVLSVTTLYVPNGNMSASLIASGLITVYNTAVYIYVNPWRAFNLGIYAFRTLTSRSVMASGVMYFSYTISISGALLHSVSYGRRLFIFSYQFCAQLQRIIDVKNEIDEVITKIDVFITSIMAVAKSGEFLLAVCIVIPTTLTVVVVLHVIPFSAALGPDIAMEITKVMKGVVESIKMGFQLASVMVAIRIFYEKLRFLNKPLKFDMRDYLGILGATFGQMPLATGAVAIAVSCWERTGSRSKETIFALSLILATIGVFFTSFLLVLKVAIVRTIDLYIISVTFTVTRHFGVLILSFLMSFASLVCMMVYTGMSQATNMKQVLQRRQKMLAAGATAQAQLAARPRLVQTEENPGIELDDGPNKEVVYDSYLCKDLYQVSCPCCVDKRRIPKETPSKICSMICRRMIPCLPQPDDHRNVCCYPATKCCPWQHGDNRDDFLRRNDSLHCCCCKIDVDLYDLARSNNMLCWKSGAFPIALIYSTLALVSGFLMFKSFGYKWYKLVVKLKRDVLIVIMDKGPEAIKRQLMSIKAELDSKCPNDPSAAANFALGAMIITLVALIPKIQKMMKYFDESKDTVQAMPIFQTMSLAVKIFFAFFLVISYFLLFLATIANLLNDTSPFISMYISESLSIFLSGLFGLLMFASMFNAMMLVVPIFVIRLVEQEGWYFAVYAYFALFITIGLFVIDYIAMPSDILKPIDLDEQIEAADEDMNDCLEINMDQIERILAKKVLPSFNSKGASFSV